MFNFSIALTLIFSKTWSLNCFFKVEFWTSTNISDGFTPTEISSEYLSTKILVRKSTLIKFNNILLMDYFITNAFEKYCKTRKFLLQLLSKFLQTTLFKKEI